MWPPPGRSKRWRLDRRALRRRRHKGQTSPNQLTYRIFDGDLGFTEGWKKAFNRRFEGQNKRAGSRARKGMAFSFSHKFPQLLFVQLNTQHLYEREENASTARRAESIMNVKIFLPGRILTSTTASFATEVSGLI